LVLGPIPQGNWRLKFRVKGLKRGLKGLGNLRKSVSLGMGSPWLKRGKSFRGPLQRFCRFFGALGFLPFLGFNILVTLGVFLWGLFSPLFLWGGFPPFFQCSFFFPSLGAFEIPFSSSLGLKNSCVGATFLCLVSALFFKPSGYP